MKRVLSVLVTVLLLLSLVSCGASSTTAATTKAGTTALTTAGTTAAATTVAATQAAAGNTKNGKPYKIGIFLKDSTTMFWRYIMSGATTKAKALGVQIVEYSPASYTDSAGQLTMLEDAIESGIDAICIAAIDSVGVVKTLQAAEQKKIPVIVFNTLIPDFDKSGMQRTFVGIDNYAASFEVTDKILKEHNYKANLVILEGTPATQMNKDRTDPIYAIAKDHPDVKIVATQPCNANREKAMTVMENILQSTPSIDVVWALNDPTALGALQAIEAAKRTGIDIVSIDGTPEACAAIVKARSIKYTADQAPFDMGALTIQAAVDALNGKTLEKKIKCGGTLVGPTNAKDHLAKYYPDYKY